MLLQMKKRILVMMNHIFNKKAVILACVLVMNIPYVFSEEVADSSESLYPATVENFSEETYFQPAEEYAENNDKRFNYKFWESWGYRETEPLPQRERKFSFFNKEREKAPVAEDLTLISEPSEQVFEPEVSEIDSHEKPNRFRFWNTAKDKCKEFANSDGDYNKLEAVNLTKIQQKIEEDKLFHHDTVNKVYLDRFNTILDDDSKAFYEGKKIMETKGGQLQLVAEEEQPSIYELIKEIENSNPDNVFEPPIKISLRDCIGIAIAKHPEITSAQLNTEIYKSRIIQAWASYFPSLSASVDYSYMHSKMPHYSYGLNSAYFPNASAGLLLFDFGKTKAYVDMAKIDYSASKFDLQNSINDIIYSVKSAYYNLLFAQKQVEVYKATIEEFELHLQAARKYFSIGKKPQVDVAIAEYNVGSAKLNLVKAMNTLEVAKISLANTLGLPEFANFELSEGLTKSNFSTDLDSLLEDAFSIRPDLLSYQKSVESSLLAVRKARRDFAPDLTANSSIYHGGADPMKETNYNVSVNLGYSGMNLMQIKKEFDIAKKTYEKSLTDYETKRQSVYLEVKEAYINLNNSRESVKQAELNVEQAKAQHYHATGRYKAGLGDAIELKDSENTYMNAQLEFYQSLLDYNNDIANLERVVGRPIELTDADL